VTPPEGADHSTFQFGVGFAPDYYFFQTGNTFRKVSFFSLAGEGRVGVGRIEYTRVFEGLSEAPAFPSLRVALHSGLEASP
jgi:hypothetical protein